MKYNKDIQRNELEQQDISDEFVMNLLKGFRAIDFDASIFLLNEESKELIKAEEQRTGEAISMWTILGLAAQFIGNENRVADWCFSGDGNQTDSEH